MKRRLTISLLFIFSMAIAAPVFANVLPQEPEKTEKKECCSEKKKEGKEGEKKECTKAEKKAAKKECKEGEKKACCDKKKAEVPTK